jgi:tRNA pseudouridine55 synthase
MITLEQLQAGIVIPVDKPRQWTSFQAVNKIKAVVRSTYGLKKFKIGHAGTLDPLATGLLLVCIGKATKTIPQLQDGDKVYTGTMVFGATTPCYDLERPVDHYYPYEHITQQLVEETAQQFTGTIQQVPPMFSAVKIAGQRAYEYAREGERLKVKGETDTVETKEIKPKEVNIYSFEITAFRKGERSKVKGETADAEQESLTFHLSPFTSHLYQNPLGKVPPHLPQADFRIHCGKGTYIRSLARDLGLAIGSGAFLSALRREKVGEYSINQSIKPDEIQQYLTSL